MVEENGSSVSPPDRIKASIAASLSQAATRLRAISDTPRLEAELILGHTLGLSRAQLYAHSKDPLDRGQQTAFQRLLRRRLAHEPLPYLTGHIEFYGLDFRLDPRVLIPRPETERIVTLALDCIATNKGSSSPFVVADVGTGSGCIAIALARQKPDIRVYGLDLSADALAVARANAARHGVADRVRFVQSDLLTALAEAVDLIVANPPYVAADEWSTLPPEVSRHEPRLALYGGPDGLDVIRRLLEQTATRLRPGGTLLIEIGATQGATVARLAHETVIGADVSRHSDLGGRERVLRVQIPLDSPATQRPTMGELYARV